MRKLITTAALLLAGVTNASAGSMTGGELYDRLMNSKSPLHMAQAAGYVTGSVDALFATRVICSPPGFKTTASMQVVVDYIRSNPAARLEDGPVAVADAFIRAYPCPYDKK